MGERSLKVIHSLFQLLEYKKRVDEDTGAIDGLEELKKRLVRDMETMQQRIDTLEQENDKVNRSKKKLQAELEDVSMELDTQRSSFTALEKKQRKFDQNLAEEKAISER